VSQMDRANGKLVRFSRFLLRDLWSREDTFLDHQQHNICLELFSVMWPHVERSGLDTSEHELFSGSVRALFHKCRNLSTTCQLMKALSVLVAFDMCDFHLVQSRDVRQHMELWLSLIVKHTYRTKSSEPLRLASSRGLQVAGSSVMKWILQQIKNNGDWVSRVFQAYCGVCSCVFKTVTG